MISKARVVLFLFCLAAALQLQAQKNSQKDSVSPPVDSTKFFSFSGSDFLIHVIEKKPISNRLDGVTAYRPTNAGLGNLGHPEKSLTFPLLPEPGMNRGREYFEFFGYDNEKRKTFYDVQRPYTNITAVLGQKQEQFVRITHAQNFGKRFNIAFGFNRNRSEGFYLRQQVDNTALFLTSYFRSRDNRYSLLVNTYWKTVTHAENGGIINDTLFEDNQTLNRQLIGVNLSQAESFNRRRGVWIKQFWSFGQPFPDNLQDTTQKRKRIEPHSALFLITAMEDRTFQYTDKEPLGGFYSNVYRDTNETNDSTHLLKFENSFGWQLLGIRNLYADLKPAFSISVGHQAGRIIQDTISSPFADLFVQASAELRQPYFNFQKITAADGTPGIEYQSGFSGFARMRYIFSGTHAGDYSSALRLSYAFRDKSKSTLQAELTQRKPEWIYMHYSGNHFQWLNDFQQTGLMRFTLEQDYLPWHIKVGGSYNNYSNPVYFDTLALPAQLNGTTSGMSVFLQHLLKVKWFNLQSLFLYNGIAESSVIRLPAFVARNSMFVELVPKKKTFKLQLGLDLFYHSAYLADDYMPNTGQFFLQNNSKLGNYPFVDFWVSMKIKSVRAFFKIDHVNSGLLSSTYYLVPHYPQNDRSLKFGISWSFND